MESVIVTYGQYFLAAIAFGLLFAPVVHYLLFGWAAKRQEILDNFTDESIEKYFALFFPTRPKAQDSLKSDFAHFYNRRFGRKHFIIPIVVLFVVSCFLIFFASMVVFEWMRRPFETKLDVPKVAIAAFAGAYVWVLLDLITKAYLCDLKPINLLGASFRLIIAVPLGVAVAAMLKDDAGIPIAFFLGAFPTRSITTMAHRLVISRLNLENSSTPGTPELQSLQGINRSAAERFEFEGVSTILQLAYSDPIALMMRTNFSFSYVTDCCSQALAWLYFEKKLALIRCFGLRGAQEISVLIDEKKSPDNAERANKCISEAAAKVQVNPEVFEWALRQIAEDPYTEFLCEVWCMD